VKRRGDVIVATCAALASFVIAMPGCSTRDLINKFNSGLLDSTGDPNHSPTLRHRDLVKALVLHELMDGFFTQGSSTGAVAQWLDFAGKEPHAFVRAVHAHAVYLGNNLGMLSPEADASPAIEASAAFAVDSPSKKRFTALGAYWRRKRPPAAGPICGGGRLNAAEASELADALRFDAAVERAGTAVTAIAIEGLVNLADIQEGSREAFAELGSYLRHRRWNRQFDRHVNGVVVKGGASTGLYSAGVVWVALHLIDSCIDSKVCLEAAGDPRFTLISGTSTGAMIAVAADLFNNAKTPAGRATALRSLATWFTCKGSNDLYCVRDADALEMLKHQRGLVEFDGIQSLLAKNVTCEALRNSSELILNTVNFRTGNLYDLSDQDELRSPNDVVQAAIASAVLPFIAQPVPHLPVDYDRQIEQTYLDGGIRSELPILPLVRRGAERVLVVSSSASITAEMKDLENGLSIATRFIDVSTGGVTESEIQHAERHVESVRLAEMDNCKGSEVTKSACSGDDRCVTAFCQSDWDEVCEPPGTDGIRRRGSPLDLSGQRLASLWQTRSFFRNEEKVEALHGYNFDPIKQRQLFLAGAEDARVRCIEIADLLGIPTKKLGKELVGWCAPNLPGDKALCPDQALAANDLRACGAPSNPASTAVCP
jgi:predicted acylesterase/phospholipase RssA